MALPNNGPARVPGSLGATPGAGQTTHARGMPRTPTPLNVGPSIWVMDQGAVKLLQKTLRMPPPFHDRTKHVRVVGWDLGAGSPHTNDVLQGDLANCPVASILAAMANTPKGSERIKAMVEEHPGKVVTDLSAVMDQLDDDPDWKDRPKDKKITSNRYFTVNLAGGTEEVSDVLYTDQSDKGWDLIYIGYQGIRKDKGMKGVLWPSVIEKAYAAQLTSYEKLDAVNDPRVAWKVLMGSAPKQVEVKDLKDADITRIVAAASQVPTIAATRDDRQDLTPDDEKDAKKDTHVEQVSGGLLEGWHGYAVKGMAGGMIDLYDPHGKSVKVTLAQFKKFFVTIVYGAI